MTDTLEETGVVDEIKAWLEENWDPELTVAEWWERLGTAGWSAPTLPVGSYGKGLSRGDAVLVQQAIADHGALGAPGGLGLLLAAPTIAMHGTPEQVEEYVRPIVTGQRAWCQLFSEPGAGSDLAGLQCKAEQDGEEWIVNGQKVWTSGGQVADMGMLIARTNPNVPKHQGITYFAIDMHQPGIDVRPLKEMTGRAMFNEVFLTDARVGDEAMISGKNNGWAVANTTLMFERAGLGSGGGSSAASAATPGTVAGDLEQAGRRLRRVSAARVVAVPASAGWPTMLIDLAKGNKTIDDPTIRQGLMKLHTFAEIGRFNNLRVKAEKEAGQGDPRHGEHLQAVDERDDAHAARPRPAHRRRLRHAPRLRLEGTSGDRRGDGNPFLGIVTELALFAQGPPIYGGTDQVQRNIIGERVLGLPKEPNNDRTVNFADMPKNV